MTDTPEPTLEEKLIEALQRRWLASWKAYLGGLIKMKGAERAGEEVIVALAETVGKKDVHNLPFFQMSICEGIRLIEKLDFVAAQELVFQLKELAQKDSEINRINDAWLNRSTARGARQASFLLALQLQKHLISPS